MSDARPEQVSKHFRATIRPPGSKSMGNRALVLAALNRDQCELRNVLFADDTAVMLDSLRKLGITLEIDEGKSIVRVLGCRGKLPVDRAELFCGNSGTTIRFLTAMCSLGRGDFTLDGNARMRQRPIGTLTSMLKNLGVRVSHADAPPITVHADGLPGGYARFGSESSSQYLSAILMAAPYARNEVFIALDGRQTSWPYVTMTMRMMDDFGITPELERDVDTGEPKAIVVPMGFYTRDVYEIEPDASGASYFFALAAMHEGSSVLVEGLSSESLQGDVGFAEILRQMGARVDHETSGIRVTGTGVLRGGEFDLLAMPDVAQTLAVLALFASEPVTMHGLASLRVKETDRLAALETEITKLGGRALIFENSLTIEPPKMLNSAAIDTYDDHRMAMSFALAATKRNGIVIRDAACVSKTFPRYFDELARVTSS